MPRGHDRPAPTRPDPSTASELIPDLEYGVANKVEGGRYKSASEVMREGLGSCRSGRKNTLLGWTRCGDIQIGIDELDRGEGVDGEPVFERILARIAHHEEGRS